MSQDGDMSKTLAAVVLPVKVHKLLTEWIQAHGTPQQVVKRCRIILRHAEGSSDVETAAALGLSRHTCRLWRERFATGGPPALWKVAPGRGRKADGPRQQRIVEATTTRKPKGQTHWSARTLARDQGVSHATVLRVWRAHQLKPHLHTTFKVSRDPRFLQKLTDVVGLYLNTPDRAIVLCVDEKSQIQALDRTQPGLPMKKGRCGTMTHDYKRNGTTTLFAALEVLTGKVVGQCHPRHRHQEFIRFLKKIDGAFPGTMELHLVLDNYGTHKTDQVRAWLAKHPRFVLHFIPTSSSWLNLVERWFRELTQKALKRGVFVSVPDLERAIAAFLEGWNDEPNPFVWTATVESIMKKVYKCRQALEKIEPGCTLPKRRKKVASGV
jgi:transposase